MKKLNTLDRNKVVEHLQSEAFDLAVIGGGITGAGIALDASSRGMKVALVEKDDFASGTSSKSTKLIHGGLRYLKQFEIDLVREVGKERAILHKNAPHLVMPDNMLLPIIEDGSLGRVTSFLGLSVYDWLAGVKFTERKRMLSKYATRKKEPLLRNDILKGGAIYKEYRTDDARLVIEALKTAVQYETYALNYAKAKDLLYEDGKVVGVLAMDRIGEQEINIKASKVINATGPWVDEIREKDKSLRGKRLHLTKGVHLVVPYEKLPVKQSAYFDVDDGRMIFVIPRGEITYIGTTDTDYKKDTDHPTTTAQDVDYLLEAVNFIFPSVKLERKDVASTWSGLRPLIHEEGKSPSELSRKDEIFFSSSGLMSIAGGKLTGFRKMAERIVDIVAGQFSHEEGRRFKPCFTDKITLSGGHFRDEQAIPGYINDLTKSYSPNFSQRSIHDLVYKYGSNTEIILENAINTNRTHPDEKLLSAELRYGIHEEIVTNLSDFLIRRTGRLYFERPSIEKIYPFLKEIMEEIMGWDKNRAAYYDEQFMKEYEAVLNFN